VVVWKLFVDGHGRNYTDYVNIGCTRLDHPGRG
jgi:hypothetical protein